MIYSRNNNIIYTHTYKNINLQVHKFCNFFLRNKKSCLINTKKNNKNKQFLFTEYKKLCITVKVDKEFFVCL